MPELSVARIVFDCTVCNYIAFDCIVFDYIAFDC